MWTYSIDTMLLWPVSLTRMLDSAFKGVKIIFIGAVGFVLTWFGISVSVNNPHAPTLGNIKNAVAKATVSDGDVLAHQCTVEENISEEDEIFFLSCGGIF